MSALGRKDLAEALATKPDDQQGLFVTPLLDDEGQIGPGAIDLRLGTEFLLLRRTLRSGLDPRTMSQQNVDEMQQRVAVPFNGELWLHPRHFVLAATLEFLGLPDDMCAYLVGRSSWGRLGLLVATAVFVHPGFRGCLTLELVNEGDAPICLSPGMRIAQLTLHRLASPAPRDPDEKEKYQAPVRPQPSRLADEQSEFAELSALGEQLRSRLG
jgi:dCTP deaminase